MGHHTEVQYLFARVTKQLEYFSPAERQPAPLTEAYFSGAARCVDCFPHDKNYVATTPYTVWFVVQALGLGHWVYRQYYGFIRTFTVCTYLNVYSASAELPKTSTTTMA